MEIYDPNLFKKITIKDLSEFTGASEATISRWRKSSKIDIRYIRALNSLRAIMENVSQRKIKSRFLDPPRFKYEYYIAIIITYIMGHDIFEFYSGLKTEYKYEEIKKYLDKYLQRDGDKLRGGTINDFNKFYYGNVLGNYISVSNPHLLSDKKPLEPILLFDSDFDDFKELLISVVGLDAQTLVECYSFGRILYKMKRHISEKFINF